MELNESKIIQLNKGQGICKKEAHKLNLCPFCGGKARLFLSDEIDTLDEEDCEKYTGDFDDDTGITNTDWFYGVQCGECSSGIGDSYINYEDSIKKWNRRFISEKDFSLN